MHDSCQLSGNPKTRLKMSANIARSNNHDESCSVAVASDLHHPFAFTILWSPLPTITWILPFIGHMGIATSRGIACDFQGPYSVGDRGRMAFGRPTRSLRFDTSTLPGKCHFVNQCNEKICTNYISIAIYYYSLLMLCQEGQNSGIRPSWRPTPNIAPECTTYAVTIATRMWLTH